MPKYNYNEKDWALTKDCYYCGKPFFPKENEEFCSHFCEESMVYYLDTFDDYMLSEYHLKGDNDVSTSEL